MEREIRYGSRESVLSREGGKGSNEDPNGVVVVVVVVVEEGSRGWCSYAGNRWRRGEQISFILHFFSSIILDIKSVTAYIKSQNSLKCI